MWTAGFVTPRFQIHNRQKGDSVKKMILLVLILASASMAEAGFVCEQTCSGTSLKVIDASLPRRQKDKEAFQEVCQKRGGIVITGGNGDAYNFDDLGCRVGDFRPYSYCAVEEKVAATGLSITAIDKNQGGRVTATSGAAESCKMNLRQFNCGQKTQAPVRDVSYGEFNCREF
jgi:hypothetical protein